jgi:hypothetical protein
MILSAIGETGCCHITISNRLDFENTTTFRDPAENKEVISEQHQLRLHYQIRRRTHQKLGKRFPAA